MLQANTNPPPKQPEILHRSDGGNWESGGTDTREIKKLQQNFTHAGRKTPPNDIDCKADARTSRVIHQRIDTKKRQLMRMAIHAPAAQLRWAVRDHR